MFRSSVHTQHCSPDRWNAQKGSALIIALVFLLIMTLIGVTGMQGTSQQEKMAGNMRDRNLAFQAAEAALRTGERRIDPPGGTPPDTTAFNDTTPGLITQQNQGTDPGGFWATYFSTNSGNAFTITTNLTDVGQLPAYVIEEQGALNAACSTPGPRCFRITARATGGTTDAVVILQSTYVRP